LENKVRTAKDVVSIIKDHIDKNQNFYYWDGKNGEELDYNWEKLSIPDYQITKESSYGGNEGCGWDYWFVFKLTNKQTNESVYIKFDGIYSSWGDPEWYEPFLVEPKEKVVIVFERVGE